MLVRSVLLTIFCLEELHMRNTFKLPKVESLTPFINLSILFILMLILLTGCSSSKTEELQKEVDNLSSQYEELQKNYKNLDKEYQELLSEHETLQSEIEKYQDQQKTIDELNNQVAELQNQNNTLQAEKESLASQVSSLQDSQSQDNASSGGNGWRIPGAVSNASSDSSGGMVWLSATGDKYHSINNCGRMNPNNATQVSQSDAEARGYGRCSKCF